MEKNNEKDFSVAKSQELKLSLRRKAIQTLYDSDGGVSSWLRRSRSTAYNNLFNQNSLERIISQVGSSSANIKYVVNLSNFAYATEPTYSSIIDYLSNFYLWRYYYYPIKIKEGKGDYEEVYSLASEIIDGLNIEITFPMIISKVLREGIAYLYVKYQSYMRSTIRATAEAHGKDTSIVRGDTITKWVRDPRIAEAMVDQRIVVPGLVDSTQVLTFTALEAIEYGFCDGIAANIDEVAKQLGHTNYKIVSYQPTFYDGLKGMLNSSILRGILVLIIMGGIYFEMQSPGIGFPLLAAATAAVLYFAPLYMDGLAANWEIIIFVVGIILIALEIFVIPGFGIAGISGIVLAIAGLTLGMVDNVVFDFENVDGTDFIQALLTVFLGLSGGIILTLYLSNKILTSKKGAFSKVALNTSQYLELGYISVDSTLKALVGKTGVAATDLRPSGKVIIEDENYDARASEGYIEKGKNIKVFSFTSGQLNVRQDI